MATCTVHETVVLYLFECRVRTDKYNKQSRLNHGYIPGDLHSANPGANSLSSLGTQCQLHNDCQCLGLWSWSNRTQLCVSEVRLLLTHDAFTFLHISTADAQLQSATHFDCMCRVQHYSVHFIMNLKQCLHSPSIIIIKLFCRLESQLLVTRLL